ncbi:phytoene desaturase family protein [Agaribacterium haliotis]|uniref:phytoene desaturase family protein n=1 Tax=Agaribacterium haliotis TaxID=2013869 RepID=UPI000BB58243|nr:FAD-dependent oxidoreductase [Agaribacterium haliotis]
MKTVVIGAGLAGLICALRLQKSGCDVLLVEKAQRVGGLCGTFFRDGYEFTIACNDFGWGLVEELNELGVNCEFESKKTQVFYRDQKPTKKQLTIQLPPGPGLLAKLLGRQPLQFLAFIWGIVRANMGLQTGNLQSFAQRFLKPGPVRDLVELPAYLMGVAPYDLANSYALYDKKFGYNYAKPACPVGGPQKMADAIAEAFVQAGGELVLADAVDKLDSCDGGHTLQLASGRKILADKLVDTRERPAPCGVKRGVALSMLLLVVDKRYKFPEGVHTLIHYPECAEQWAEKIDQGLLPTDFAFHIFKSDLDAKADHYSLNCFFYFPRGQEQPNQQCRDFYLDYIDQHLEQLLPGVKKSLIYQQLFSAADFAEEHKMSSRVMPSIGIDKVRQHDAEAKLWCAGHSVWPPGDHAGAAALSGRLVAEAILAD